MPSIKIFCRRRRVNYKNRTRAVRRVEGDAVNYCLAMSTTKPTSFSSGSSTRSPFNRSDHVLILLSATFIFILFIIDEASLAWWVFYQIAWDYRYLRVYCTYSTLLCHWWVDDDSTVNSTRLNQFSVSILVLSKVQIPFFTLERMAQLALKGNLWNIGCFDPLENRLNNLLLWADVTEWLVDALFLDKRLFGRSNSCTKGLLFVFVVNDDCS